MEKHFPGGIEIVRGSFMKKGIPNSAIKVLLKSLSDSTLRQYTSTYKQWWSFCKNHNIENIYAVSVGTITLFLSELFELGISYSTLNAHKAALSLILNISSSDEQLLKRFLKGAFRIKPSFPKYSVTWDPSKVLDFIKGWYPLESLSLEKLTKKLAILLVLATGQRVQTISKINTKNITHTEEGFTIQITDILKTSHYNKQQPMLKIKNFLDHPELCVANTLDKYLEVSKPFRNGEEYLFLTFRKPYHKASTQSISRWVKDVLKASGIDTTKFKAHSTRHASTSAAYRSGVNIDTIKDLAGWSKKSQMFAKFYNRPLQNDVNFIEIFCGDT